MSNNSSQKRQPPGTKDGGKWAPDVNQESTVVLDDTHHQMPEGFAVVSPRTLAGATWIDTVSTTYDDLVRTFGEPQFSDLKVLDGGQSTTEWYLETPSGVVHIYDAHPDNLRGRPLGKYAWRIGGFDTDVVEDIKNEISLRDTYGPVTARANISYDFGNGPEPAHRHTNGSGWVADTATVDPTVFVGPDAKVCNFAKVTNGARLSGHAIVMDRAIVCDNALIVDAVVMDDATVSGEARVLDRAAISDRAWVAGFASVHGDAVLLGDARVLDHANIFDHAVIGGHAVVKDNAAVFDHAAVRDSARMNGNARACGEATIYENATLGGNAMVGGGVKLHGTHVISGPTTLTGFEDYPGPTKE